MRSRPHIFLIDDDPLSNMITHRMISHTYPHWTISCFECGRKVLGELKERREDTLPDLLVVDLNMPGFSGWELLETLEAAGQTRKIPVAILTSSIDPNDRERAKQHPLVNEFLIKPLRPETLQKVLENHLI
ncbi:response regulator [Altibacter lentus]|uniref:response regulator n=1 Tax=Altibacter lentus TaxID=1223410 RepID=UPI0005510BCD|nr:response regulator [Altibacter lentus]